MGGIVVTSGLFLLFELDTIAQCYLCWLLLTVPFLELCFAFYSWITCKYSVTSKVWIQEKAGRVWWKGFRFSVLRMKSSGWQLIRHCPAISYKYEGRIFIHSEPIKLSVLTVAMAICEEIALFCCSAIVIKLFYYYGNCWIPLLTIPIMYPMFSLRTAAILEGRHWFRLSGDPTEYEEIRGFLMPGLKTVEAGVEVIDVFLLLERFWIRNPQPLYHPLDFYSKGLVLE